MQPTEMDYVRSLLANASHSGLTLYDLERAAEHSDTVEQFDHAVNMLTVATLPAEIAHIEDTP